MCRNAISATILASLLSGCFLINQLDDRYPVSLLIVNKLAAPVYYCEAYELPACPNEVGAGRTAALIYLAHSPWERDDRVGWTGAFDRHKIRLCDKLVEFKDIRTVSAVTALGNDKYEILIDSNVHEAFCKPT